MSTAHEHGADKEQLRRQAIDDQIAALPTVGTAEFWTIVEASEPSSAGRPLSDALLPETIVWAMHQFGQRGDRTALRRLTELLFDQYDPLIRKWAARNHWVRSWKFGDQEALIDDIAQYTWRQLINRFSGPDPGYYMVNFHRALFMAVRTNARTVVRQTHRPGQDSLTTPLPSANPDEDQPGTLADILPDPRGERAIGLLDLLLSLKTALTSEELQIVVLLADGFSRTEIGKILGIYRETVSARLKRIQRIVAGIISHAD